MLIKINRAMRKIVFVLGAVFLVAEVFGRKKPEKVDKETFNGGFQREEFDDIW